MNDPATTTISEPAKRLIYALIGAHLFRSSLTEADAELIFDIPPVQYWMGLEEIETSGILDLPTLQSIVTGVYE